MAIGKTPINLGQNGMKEHMNKLNEAALLPGQKDLPSKLLHFIATCRREKDGGSRGVGRRRFPVRRWWGVRKKHLISPRLASAGPTHRRSRET